MIGVVQTVPFCCDLFVLEWDQIETLGKRRGGSFDVTIPKGSDGNPWKKIKSFSERI